METNFPDRLFAVNNEDFTDLAIDIFHFQYKHNPFIKHIRMPLESGLRIFPPSSQIPFLPIDFFKHFQVMTASFTPEIVFESSGTTQTDSKPAPR